MDKPKLGLTPTQLEILNFIKIYKQHFNYFPTYREIAKGTIDNQEVIKRRSSGVISHHVHQIQERGYIKLFNKPRAFEIL